MKQAKDLTREETIKALQKCSAAGGTCEGCPLHGEHDEYPFGDCDPNFLLRHAAEILEKVSYE